MSLHADSLVDAPDVRGASIYTLSERASNDEAARLASKENRADILAGIDLSNQEEIVTEILIDLAQRDTNNKSIEVADLMVNELGSVTKMARLRRSQAGFVVLKSPDMPSVLVELGYLSNADDEQALRSPAHLAELAKAIVKAIDATLRPRTADRRDVRPASPAPRRLASLEDRCLRKLLKLLGVGLVGLLILAIVGAGGALYLLHRYGSDLPDYRAAGRLRAADRDPRSMPATAA